jgi:hypothetical protein
LLLRRWQIQTDGLCQQEQREHGDHGTMIWFALMRAGLLLAILCACGGELRLRPLSLDVQGLSGRAERLVVLLFPVSAGQTCANVGLENVKSQRKFDLPAIEERGVTVIAYSEDAQGMPIQFGCTQIDYADIESPEASLRLSMRMASRSHMVPACRSSGPSSSSGCSVAVEWRRPSSVFARATRSIIRSS